MNNDCIISLFQDKCKTWLEAASSLVYPNIKESDRAKVRTNFQLYQDETILFVHDPSIRSLRKKGLVITDWGITIIQDNDESNEIVTISWQGVDYVEYKELALYLYDFEESYTFVPMRLFGYSDEFCSICGKHIADAFTEIAQSVEPEEDPFDKMDEEIDGMIENEDYEEAIATIKRHINNDDGTYKTAWYIRLAHIYKDYLGKYEEAKQACLKGLEYCEEGSESSVYVHWVLNKTLLDAYNEDNNNYTLAKELRKESFYVTQIATDEDLSDDILVADDSKSDFESIDEKYSKYFLSLPYNERKVLMPVRNYTDLSQDHIAVLKIDRLSSKIDFPIGHPIANQVYVGHPFLPHKYIPFENYQLELIEDKVREFCQIAQCLGATEISIDTVNSSQSDNTRNYTQDINGGVGYKGVGAGVSWKKSDGRRLIEEISQAINLHQTFTPTKAPYLPEKTVWYQNEPSWQRLYEQRMNGGLTQHEERIETRKNQVVDNHELQEVKAELQYLFASANLNWNTSFNESFSQQENAILSINVKFAPIESIGNNVQPQTPTSSLTDLGQEYLDLVKDCLEDGEIGSRERKLLDKIRVKNGISEERAKELESTLTVPRLTDDEKEYLEAFKDACEDGLVSDKQRRLLEKLRVMYGISEERAKELENRN